MVALTSNAQEEAIRIVGSSVFGRYPSISQERTYNMFISESGDKKEQWLVNFAGYKARKEFFEDSLEGRAIFHSVRGDFLICVIEGTVFRLNSEADTPINIGTLASTSGTVFVDENLSSQICLVDGADVYIYNYLTSTFALATLTNPVGGSFDPSEFLANFVTYQDTYFIFGNGITTNAGSQWYVFQKGTAATELEWVQTLTLQTKSDFAKAALRIPGKGNNLLVFGTTVAEIWTDVGGLEVYQRNSSVNVDYGTISVSTIAASDQYIVWLSVNESASPAIMVMLGGQAQRLSTDGIDALLQTITAPTDSTAFFFRQDGHLFYQLTFFNSADQLTIIYDFTTNKFYDLTDWDFTHHPARKISYFKGKTYFVSLKDGHLYEMSSDLTTYDREATVSAPKDIPRVRITDTFRGSRPEKFIVNLFTFYIEAGTTEDVSTLPVCYGLIIDEEYGLPILTSDGGFMLTEEGYCESKIPRIDISISKNGGETFSNALPYSLKATGKYRAQPRLYRLGACNEITFQLRFWSAGRFVIKDATIEITI